MADCTAEQWNAQHPVGTRVRYFPRIGYPEHILAETRSDAWQAPNGLPLVLITGRSGGIWLRALEPDLRAEVPVYVCAECLRASCLSGAAMCPARVASAASRRPRASASAWNRSELEQLGREAPDYWDTDDQEMWRGVFAELYPRGPQLRDRVLRREVAQ